MLGLQRLLYGPLRPFEIEQLYEKAWFAITETCLAMTIFREEVGAWFLVMFVALLVGKVWGWIGEGRVEILEQQPPANPRLFHMRLSFSLLLSVIFDVSLLRYAVGSVLRMARPNMMVMFAFEFAVLAIASCSTAARYALSLVELYTIRQQTKLKLEERRAQRQMAQTQQEVDGPDAAPSATVPDDLDEDDIDVPGWEAKRQWLFSLDLVTGTGAAHIYGGCTPANWLPLVLDFLKLVVYLSFFFILLAFYGLPIHIMRDVFLTLRSFVRRVGDFVGYRRATRDMNARYPDATAEEVVREDVCIICREEMRPWRTAGPAPGAPAAVGQAAAPTPTTRPPTSDERSRPKRLPCGHILHFSCLRRWLERQQICPTCRHPVMGNGPASASAANARAAIPPQAPPGPGGHHVQVPPLVGAPQAAVGGAQGARPANRGRIFQLGPLRIGFGVGTGPVFQDLARQMQNGAAGPMAHPPPNPNHRQLSFGLGFGRPPAVGGGAGAVAPPAALDGLHANVASTVAMQLQLQQLEQQLLVQYSSLRITADQLRLLQTLQLELARLRQMQIILNGIVPSTGIPSLATHTQVQPTSVTPLPSSISGALPRPPPNDASGLPAGITLPPGWTLTPLYRLETTSDPNSTSAVPGPSTHDEAAESSQAPPHQPDGGPTPQPSSNEAAAGPSTSISANAVTDATTDAAPSSPRPESQVPSTTHEPSADSSDARRSDADSSTSKAIPSWSSSTSGPFGGEASHHPEGSASTANGEPSQPSSSKGKARAVTVEDVLDDDAD